MCFSSHVVSYYINSRIIMRSAGEESSVDRSVSSTVLSTLKLKYMLCKCPAPSSTPPAPRQSLPAKCRSDGSRGGWTCEIGKQGAFTIGEHGGWVPSWVVGWLVGDIHLPSELLPSLIRPPIFKSGSMNITADRDTVMPACYS